MIGALTGRLLSWKHLFYKTEDKIYAIFVKKEAETMLEVAKTYNLMDRIYLIFRIVVWLFASSSWKHS